MIRKYGTFRKIQTGRPPQLNGLEWRRVIAALQHGGNKSPPPSGNIWDDTDVWDDNEIWGD